MNFPNLWVRLPGPADLLAVIKEDLSGGGSVLLGLPEDMPGSLFAVEVAELTARFGFGQWETVQTDESCETAPRAYVGQRFNGGEAKEFVLWVDATSQTSAAQAWVDYAQQSAGVAGTPRMCIAMDMAYADVCQEEKGVRRRVWSDFVTPLDSRVLVEQACRRSGNSPMHTALKSALVAELAGGDLSLADRLSRQGLGGIFDSPMHSPERIWAATDLGSFSDRGKPAPAPAGYLSKFMALAIQSRGREADRACRRSGDWRHGEPSATDPCTRSRT